MADRKLRRVVLVAAAISIAGACDRDVDSQARLIDDACESGCATEGSAREVSGLTADSLGYRIGPGPGKVTIRIPDATVYSADTLRLEALVSGRGSFKSSVIKTSCGGDAGTCTSSVVDSESIVVRDDYAWKNLGYYSSSSTSVIKGITVELETQDDFAEVDLLDIRYDAFDTVDCSVSAVGRRR